VGHGTPFACQTGMIFSNTLDVPVQAGEVETPRAPLTDSIDADLLQGLDAVAELLGNACNALDVPVQAGEVKTPRAPLTDSVDVDLLQGLDALADLLGNASETLTEGLLTVEDNLNALPITQEEWVPIQGTRSSVESIETEDVGQTSQEYVFGGVPITILKLGGPVRQETRPQWNESEYQLGYSRVGNGWALMIRTARSQPSNGNGDDVCWQFSDEKPLVLAPLEVRLKGIREIPSLIKLLDRRFSEMPS
jgi:hypothetical protein